MNDGDREQRHVHTSARTGSDRRGAARRGALGAWRRAAGAALAIGAFAVACSSESTPRGVTTTLAASEERAPRPASAPASPGGRTAPNTATGNPAQGSTRGAIDTQAPFPLSVELSKKCLAPGEVQMLTARTLPRAIVLFDTIYSDGRSGGAHQGGYGGNYGGRADDKGVFMSSWVLAPNTPPGTARVRVVADDEVRVRETSTSFVVREPTGSCPNEE